jgi:hypothetical protein
MRFMMIVKASKDSEAGVLPSPEMLAEMMAFNEEMAKAGVLLSGDGLKASSKGARVRFSGTERLVIDGPFAETKELIAGYWIIRAGSLDEAVSWAKRCPPPHGEGVETEIEIRPMFDMEDFADVAAPETLEAEARIRAAIEGQG